MKLKYLFSSILFIVFGSEVSAQKIETSITWLTDIPDAANSIIYNPNQKLTITDFKGTPNIATDAVAITSSGFMFKAGYHSVNNKATLSIAIYCSFNKNESWMKERGKNPYILSHEQHHFDITYLSTLLFIKRLKQVKFSQDEYMEQLKDIYKDVVQVMQQMQHQYDDETSNGINTLKQNEWNKKIEAQLAASAKEAIL